MYQENQGDSLACQGQDLLLLDHSSFTSKCLEHLPQKKMLGLPDLGLCGLVGVLQLKQEWEFLFITIFNNSEPFHTGAGDTWKEESDRAITLFLSWPKAEGMVWNVERAMKGFCQQIHTLKQLGVTLSKQADSR